MTLFTCFVNSSQAFKQSREFIAQENHDDHGIHHWQSVRHLNENVKCFIQVDRDKFVKICHTCNQKTDEDADDECPKDDMSKSTAFVWGLIA